MEIRVYEDERDRPAAMRIYREVGWVTSDEHEKAAAEIPTAGYSAVAEIDGSVESLACSASGTLRHLTTDISLAAVTTVATSRVARKRALAARLTARLLADLAEAGTDVAVLGIFEQGYYNQLGFGNGSYENWYSFDPSQLLVDAPPRIPVRLGPDDWEPMHANRLQRLRLHGACSLDSPGVSRAEILWSQNGFGLGYRDEEGALTHHVWCESKDVERGPYTVLWMAYRTKAEFMELMGLLKSLGDQVRTVKINEPPSVQLHDLVRQPFKTRQMTQRTEHESRMTALPYWQARILDLASCLAGTRLTEGPLQFNLTLSDPIAKHLAPDVPWQGIAGKYIIRLGSECGCDQGRDPALPTLRASVNAFTRLWLGVRPATSLSWTDELEGPADLLADLDAVLRLPTPHPDWEF